MITIYHNPRCGKSREALRLLEQSGKPFTIRLYMQEPLTLAELERLHSKLGIPAKEMVRTKETVFKERYAGKIYSDSDYLQAMAESPVLMERAVVETDDRAVIARPPEKLLSILD